MTGAFHAYDIRGVYGVDFDASVARKVGYFLPGLLDAKEVLVGRDCRLSSPEIHDALVTGINDAGADVVDLGLCTTPMVYFATAQYGFRASVQITASHNSPECNGLKISRENALPVGLDSGLGRIRDWIEEGRPCPAAPVRGKIRSLDITDDYLQFQRRFTRDLSGIRIAFDLSNGMACLLARKIFGDDPVYIYDDMDGSFPNHEPNPLVSSNREALCRLVEESGADVGVIFDGDADRVMFVDEKSRFVPPDLVIALMSEYFIGERGEKNPVVLQEIRSSKAVPRYLEALGASVRTWRVGRAYAAPKLREIDGLWGGELAGHYYFKDFFYSDSGILAAQIVLGIVCALKKRGLTLSRAIDSIGKYRNSGEINFRIERKKEAMEAVKEYFTAEERPLVTMDFDGYRIEFRHWWFNIRPSNTEPYLRFICEADSDELLSEKVSQARRIIEEFN
ncbi:MAG: phosphomannomutase/phosphoglucomutase [Bacteroidales bacterium]|nr:phosphomannomutase/phosphoglucomutase [Bacteroidales bacterium]